MDGGCGQRARFPDTAQISANERFALSYPEKRPFFLEGVELFSTPLRAVYTRAITSPRWGGRATGKMRGVGYTVLVADDEGGGSVIIPGPNGSTTAPQAFSSHGPGGDGRNAVSAAASRGCSSQAGKVAAGVGRAG